MNVRGSAGSGEGLKGGQEEEVQDWDGLFRKCGRRERCSAGRGTIL